MRIQTREDGVQIDQIVLSSATWLSSGPGQVAGDSTILPKNVAPSVATPPPAVAPAPVSGTPAAIPGVIQAEAFDNGGEGVAYHDTTPGNSGGAYRPGDVDVQPASGGGYNVGWAVPGEWVAYTVNVATAGAFTAHFRIAAPAAGGRFHLDVGGVDVTGPLVVPSTGAWQTWQTISKNVTLRAGRQVAKLVMDSGQPLANFDWMSFTVPAASVPVLPGRITAVNFDSGAEGVAYHDTTPGNTGGAFRSSDVDIQPSSEGGYNVGWTIAGEWLRYTVDVPQGGSYLLQLRVASRDGGGRLHVSFGGTNVTGSVAVPRTVAWQTWTTVSVPVTLAAGRQAMTLHVDTAGFNIRYIDVAVR
jgi:hypothetical protein